MNAALKSLLHLQDPPHRTALAFGAGVFIAFSPLLGLHTVMAIAAAFAFGLNRVAVLAGAWINAWALVPCYTFGTLLGAWILRVDAGNLTSIDWSRGIGAIGSTLGTLLWPFMLGNTLLGLVAAWPAYALARRVLESRGNRPKDDGGAGPAAVSEAPKT